MRWDWDDKKSEKLKNQRGISFGDAATLFDGPHVVAVKNDDPEQFMAVGFANGNLVTLIYETRNDDVGEYFWFVTLWKSTKAERAYFNEHHS